MVNIMTTLFLRIASVISLIFTLGHTLGGLRKWSPIGDNQVLRKMTIVRFDVMGANRSYVDFYMGFGWSITVAMVMQTVLLWQMASLARTDPASVRPMIAVIACRHGSELCYRLAFHPSGTGALLERVGDRLGGGVCRGPLMRSAIVAKAITNVV